MARSRRSFSTVPSAANAIDLPLAARLAAAVETCTTRADIRAVALLGAGFQFCVGGDIKGFAAHQDGISAYLRELTTTLYRAIATLRPMPKPVVVGVHVPVCAVSPPTTVSVAR